jgi:hypothetical protein
MLLYLQKLFAKIHHLLQNYLLIQLFNYLSCFIVVTLAVTDFIIIAFVGFIVGFATTEMLTELRKPKPEDLKNLAHLMMVINQLLVRW